MKDKELRLIVKKIVEILGGELEGTSGLITGTRDSDIERARLLCFRQLPNQWMEQRFDSLGVIVERLGDSLGYRYALPETTPARWVKKDKKSRTK